MHESSSKWTKQKNKPDRRKMNSDLVTFLLSLTTQNLLHEFVKKHSTSNQTRSDWPSTKVLSGQLLSSLTTADQCAACGVDTAALSLALIWRVPTTE